jgi:predicted permease
LRFGTAKPRLAGTLKPLVSNRLILRCATGVLWQVTAAPRPGVVAVALRSLGQASLPIGLLRVGAVSTRRAIWACPHAAAVRSVATFGLLPAASTALAYSGFGVR